MIYCVEDDNGIRELMVYTLNASGFSAEGFGCPSEFFKALQKQKPQLVLLDVMLPEEDGISVLKKLRENPATRDIPVIMESAKDTEYDKVIGLDLGADDYLPKPFGMMEMVSRVKAVLRRTRTPETEVIKIKNLEIDKSAHRVKIDGTEVLLTVKEFELLCLFADNPGIVFTREQLLDKIWGIDFMGETRTVDVHIGTLRAKLAAAGEIIDTVRGVGYRMEL